MLTLLAGCTMWEAVEAWYSSNVETVLECANVFLMEFLFLEGEINIALNEFYDYFSASRRLSWMPNKSRHTQLRKISQFQLDSEILFESVTNAMKLFEDVFLARLYKLSYERLKLKTWENSIARKLQTIESIYQKFSDAESTRRLEILEWIIIILLAVSILMPFIPGMGDKHWKIPPQPRTRPTDQESKLSGNPVSPDTQL